MEDAGILASMAEGAITLAGFAAVFQAFSGTYDPDGHSRVRLNSFVEGGLTVDFVAYLPAWLGSAGLPDRLVWGMPRGLIVLWGPLCILVPLLYEPKDSPQEPVACPYLAAFSLSADAYRAPAATRRVFASAEEIMVMERNMAVALDQTARADEAARSALGRLQDHQCVGSGRLVQR